MGYARPILLPLCVSLGLHGAVGWSLAQFRIQPLPVGTEPIEISYVAAPRSEVEAPPPNVKQAPAKKKIQGIPIPRLPAGPSPFQRTMEQKLKAQQAILAGLTAPPRPEPANLRPKTSTEMLADPEKGKVFISYFGEVKKKIQDTLLERYAHRASGNGSVELMFVLDSQGRIEKAFVMPRGTEANETLQRLAMQCLRESAPFGAFPPDLGSGRIAFNVTIFFDGQ